MAYNPLSAHQLPADDPVFDSKPRDLSAKSEASLSTAVHDHDPSTQYAGKSSQVIGQASNTSEGKPRPKVDPALYTGRRPQTIGPPGGYLPLVSPPLTGYFPQTRGNQRGLGPLVSPNTGGDLPTNQLESNPRNSPNPRVQSSASQPPSVKHLTCWYWANKGCKLADDVCLYAHFDTGRLADPPVKVQRGRPAVAGKNAINPQPVYNDWKGHHRAHSAVVDPKIQRQIERIRAKAAQHSTPRPVQAETANMVNQGVFGSAQPNVNFNHPHSDDHPSPPPADSYRNLSIGFEAPSQPFSQHFVQYPHQAGGHYMAPGPSAHYTGGFTHDGLGDLYGMGGNYGGMGGIYGDMGGGNFTNYGPGPHQFGGNSPNDPNAFASPGQFGGQPDDPIQEMQKQMRAKDKVITELAEIVEMLEINYGISIDDQTDTLEKFLKIARAMEEDEQKAREGGDAGSSGIIMGRAPDTPAAGPSAPPYNRPPVNHQHIHAAMQGFLNLVKMEKMVLVKTKARKHAIGEDLERIEAKRLLPGGWVGR